MGQKTLKRHRAVEDVMSQGVVEAAVRQSISEEEKQEVLQLLLRRFGPPRKRVSGPFSQQEDKLWARGEIALQAAAREKRELEARRIARRARERAEHCRLVAELEESLGREFPHWEAGAVHRCAQKAAQKLRSRWLLVGQWKGKKAKAFPRLDKQGTRRVAPGPDFSRLSVEEDPEELDARYGRH